VISIVSERGRRRREEEESERKGLVKSIIQRIFTGTSFAFSVGACPAMMRN
jgi:hypothetical protein